MQATVPNPPPVILQQATQVEQPSCKTDPCIQIEGRLMVLVGWIVDGSEKALDGLQANLTKEGWSTSPPWKVNDHFALRIYTTGKSSAETMLLAGRLQSNIFGPYNIKWMMFPSSQQGEQSQ